MKYSSSQVFFSNGKWRGQLNYKSEDGKWRKITKTFQVKGKREAQRELEAWHEQMEVVAYEEERGILPSETAGDYLRRYIDGRSSKIEAVTLSTYNGLLRQQIAPYIGNIGLDELDPDTVQGWVNELAKKYSADTVRKAFVLLRSAMTEAVDRDRLIKNPTRTVQIPKKKRPKPNSLTEKGRGQLVSFLGIADSTPANLGIMLALYTGMREGEICGLRWRYVDEVSNSLEVREALGYRGNTYYAKDPKTDGSARLIYYPDVVATALSMRRAEMADRCRAAGISFDDNFFVIGEIDGSFMHPHTLYRKWRAVADALELIGTEGKPLTFHDLRHTFATTAIKSGIDVKTVSSILGHANAAMTLNVYASADPDAKRRAAELMGRAIGGEQG